MPIVVQTAQGLQVLTCCDLNVGLLNMTGSEVAARSRAIVNRLPFELRTMCRLWIDLLTLKLIRYRLGQVPWQLLSVGL